MWLLMEGSMVMGWVYSGRVTAKSAGDPGSNQVRKSVEGIPYSQPNRPA